jgi:light-harvesting complex II chlorophyll a/b binding protein 4
MQEAEIRHSRLAMLAVIGWPMSELLAPSWMLQDGCAPSVLNGVNPLSFLAIAGFLGAAGYFEKQTSLRSNIDTPMGKQHKKDMSAIWQYGVAGDYNWDPLNLYSSCGDDWKGRKGLREVEVSHGRMAMLGITYFAAWEALTGHPIVENNLLFHPNAVLPLLAAGYVAWSQVYEVSPLDQYPIEIQYTNEGEMKLKRFKNGVQGLIDENQDSADKAIKVLKDLDDKYDIVDKLAAAPKIVEEKIRSTYKYW